jgi:S1-C subfamily serine protease
MRTALLLLGSLLIAGCQPPEPPAVAPLWTSFGLQVRDLPASAREALGISHGVMVTQVRAPADRTRILPGDVIVAVDRREIQTAEEFGRIAAAHAGRRPVAVGFLVKRTDADLFIAVEPASAQPRGAARGKPLRI